MALLWEYLVVFAENCHVGRRSQVELHFLLRIRNSEAPEPFDLINICPHCVLQTFFGLPVESETPRRVPIY